jgi:hypothetical protein
VALDLYQRGLGTRQHVDLRSTDRPYHDGSFRATGISRGHRTRLPAQPRVGGAALCIIGLVFQHAATALQPHSRRFFVFYRPA